MDFARARQLIKPHQGERLRLGLRSLYILPTRFGLLWLAGGGLLLLEPVKAAKQAPFSWDQASVYFLLTDRFHNGDPA